jgi:hypothetical protein
MRQVVQEFWAVKQIFINFELWAAKRLRGFHDDRFIPAADVAQLASSNG